MADRGSEASPRARRPALVAAILFVVALAGYLWLIRQQEVGGPPPSTWAIAAALAGLAAAAAGGAVARSRSLRLALLSASAVAGLILGVLALFDIGLAVLAGGVLALRAHALTGPGAGRRAGVVASLAGTLAALAVLGVVFVPSMVPSVGCQGGSPSFSSGWGPLAGGEGTVSGSASPNGRSVATITLQGGRTVRLTCRSGRPRRVRAAG
ncbi:MAG TPA: hypothetical protein VNN74_06175 [Candidatus Micrarchaeia archaeon]|nr:hypothetical protein [Candidatus Micrarchaeia archaeon]